MFYYLARLLLPHVGALNVFTYHTVRAGGAAFTGFLFCLLVGPWIIRQLQALKVGQFIKKDHVADLHALHKGKAGTPTMGGTMIIFSAVLSLLFWGRLTNRLLWVSVGVLVLLGTVGFLDDYIKLRRKHNDGLSARAKFAGQILTGLLLGLYLFWNPITVSATYVKARDVLDWRLLVSGLREGAEAGKGTAAGALWNALDEDTRGLASELKPGRSLLPTEKNALLEGMNKVLGMGLLHTPAEWPGESLGAEARAILEEESPELSPTDKVRRDRLLLEAVMPGAIATSHPNRHTKVGVPGFKDLYIPLGPLYVLFVVLIIVSVSNTVNLTDGLDGLAAGASVISILTYAGIAYIVSRADWSSYLFLTYVPEASELFVFGSALLGTGLGFLWFNGHPAEVFMGDTGSLALGGAIGTMAILTKQELLLPLVAGLFVLEGLSVMIQVGSYKLTGKRVFRMAPLHHHFELLGWPETKVTMRFWIIALLFALMSLGALKLR